MVALKSVRILRAAATLKVSDKILFGGWTSPDASNQQARPVITVVFPYPAGASTNTLFDGAKIAEHCDVSPPQRTSIAALTLSRKSA